MKTKIISIFILAILAKICQAQIVNPVQWEFTSIKLDAGIYEIQITAIIDNGWHIYSQFSSEKGPLPTVIHYEIVPGLVILGNPKETGKIQSRFEEVFGVLSRFYYNKVTFFQKVKIENSNIKSIKGIIEFMACKEKMCLAPAEVEFEIELKK